MCGVVAALGRGIMDDGMLQAMDAISHRGIRSRIQGTSCGAVGHVRLPIVGTGPEHDQPIQTKLSKWTIGFVGELLDFRKDNPAMDCDTELVTALWVQDGPAGFKERDGFWGIAAIHESTETLHVLTDYLGQKPMYYREDFPSAASEIDALLPFGPVTLDPLYLSAVMKWGYCPDVIRTPYREIRHLRPGELVVLNALGLQCRIRIDELQPVAYSSYGDIRTEIELAVERRVLSSDVPMAALVSGGLDSTIVYNLAKKHGTVIQRYAAVTLYDDSDYWAAHAATMDNASAGFSQIPDFGKLNVPGIKKIFYDEVSTLDALKIMQEPIDLGSLRPQIALGKAIAEAVCLTGDGADELFGGYQRSQRYDSQYSDVFQELPCWHLPRLDRAMMRNRVEVRSPFLARRVAGMALNIPWEGRQNKVILRHMFSDILPPKVTSAPKKALRAPEIAQDREYYSKLLVHNFKQEFDSRCRAGEIRTTAT
jgi:asparagine synthase (glutamine-hydrolysing)